MAEISTLRARSRDIKMRPYRPTDLRCRLRLVFSDDPDKIPRAPTDSAANLLGDHNLPALARFADRHRATLGVRPALDLLPSDYRIQAPWSSDLGHDETVCERLDGVQPPRVAMAGQRWPLKLDMRRRMG
jgi:hypothetical protein